MTETIPILLRDPKPSPRLASDAAAKVFLNREWKFRPELVTGDAVATNYNWKLGDKAPAGLTINPTTGELSWTPGDDIAPGEISVPLIVSDSDSPPQTTTLSLKLSIQDDAAQFTRLTGIFALGDQRRIFLTDQSTDRKTELHEGDKFAIADLQGTVKQISRKHVTMMVDGQELRWDIGQSLREARAQIKDY